MGISRQVMVKAASLMCVITVAGILLACGEDPVDPGDDQGWYLVYDNMLSWSPDGKEIAYQNGGNSALGLRPGMYIVNLETLERRLVCPGLICDTDWSPDGERIVFSLYKSICMIRPDGTDLQQLTSEHEDIFAMYSPDGKTITFTRADEMLPGNTYMIPSVGGDVTKVTEFGHYADWFSDGERLSLRALDSTNRLQIAILHLADDSLEILTTEAQRIWEDIRFPLVSPSGKEIIFSSTERNAKRLSLYAVDVCADPPTVRKFMAVAYYGRYSPDEKYFAYTKPCEGKGAIYVRDLATGEETRVSPGSGPDCENCPLK